MRLIQITDCHLGPQQSETLLGLNTDQSLEDVLQLIQKTESGFDHILCTGDVAAHLQRPGIRLLTIQKRVALVRQELGLGASRMATRVG